MTTWQRRWPEHVGEEIERRSVGQCSPRVGFRTISSLSLEAERPIAPRNHGPSGRKQRRFTMGLSHTRRLSRRSSVAAEADTSVNEPPVALSRSETCHLRPSLSFFGHILSKPGWNRSCRVQCVSADQRFVYVLRSLRDPARHYVGLTSHVARRLEWHNAGQNSHTARNRPWSVVVSIEFKDEATARRFERYLKSGSGRVFATRHFG
jgi:putative endonuclease